MHFLISKNSSIENSEFLVLCNDTSGRVSYIIWLLGRQLGSYSLLLPCRARRHHRISNHGCGIFRLFCNLLFNSNHLSKQPSDLPFPGKPILSLIKKSWLSSSIAKILTPCKIPFSELPFFARTFQDLPKQQGGIS